nr:hypothetical protein [Rheinheimera sp.]
MRLLLLSLMLLSTMLSSEEQASDSLEQLTSYFFAAARTGDVVILNEFLKQGFAVDERYSQSYTALMVATYAGQQQAVELLLQQGA